MAIPFAENPPIDWLLTDSRFEQALGRMKFFLEQERLALITGQTGVGKSSLLPRRNEFIVKTDIVADGRYCKSYSS